MDWTPDQKLDYLLRLPWTIEPSLGEDGTYRVLRVRELPSVIATGTKDEELERDFWESLRASLEAYLHFGDPIPKPPPVQQLPWEGVSEPEPQSVTFAVRELKQAWHVSRTPATAQREPLAPSQPVQHESLACA